MKPSIIIGTIDGNIECIETQRDFDDVYRAEWDWVIRQVRGECAVENPADTAIYSTLLMQAQLESGMTKTEVNIHEIAKNMNLNIDSKMSKRQFIIRQIVFFILQGIADFAISYITQKCTLIPPKKIGGGVDVV